MRVRSIFWFRTDKALPRKDRNLYILEMYWFPGGWHKYNCMDTFKGAHTREEFERHYLEWKAQNEG